MPRTPKEVTDAELAVLEVLWEGESASVREISEALYGEAGSSENATVQKLCERLLAKDCVARDASRRPAHFHALIDRTQLIGRHLKGVADKLCEGSLTPLLTHLVEAAKLDGDEIAELRAQVERLDSERRASPTSKRAKTAQTKRKRRGAR